MKLGEDTIQFGGLEDKTEQAVKFGTKSPLEAGEATTGALSQVNHLFVQLFLEMRFQSKKKTCKRIF